MPLLNKTRARSEAHNPPIGRSGTAPDHSWSAVRIALTAFFAIDGFLFAAWVVRIPDIRAQVSASHSALGLALLCISAGAVATMPLIGRLCVRYGSRPVTVGSLVALSLSVLLPAHLHSVLGLGLVLILFGAAYGAANVSMNSAAVDLVAELRRPVMPSFHAGYSLGGLVGAAVGGLLAGRLSTAWALGLSGLLGLLVTALAGTALLRGSAVATSPAPRPVTPATPDTSGPGVGSVPKARTSLPSGAARVLVLLLGLTALCDAYGEGALADWATLHLTDDVNASAGLAATGFAAYAFAMTAGRVGGTWLSVRLGQTRVMLFGGLTAGTGMLIGALAPTVPVVLAGFVLVGLGLSNIFPLAIAQAGAIGGPRGVATASTLGYAGMLIGPPVIGFLADATSLPLALTSVAATSAVAGLLAVTVRPRRSR
ncbi:MFS transporter [Saccharothrix sp. ST-888]|uniref:MFS transporter n=1 Tax=Saccharothrix sp. ST-888 TaxID=1427391 RepID=UPI000697FB0E|nr:MFS transporter [Saccharothrix sp. ST-888]